VEATEMTVGPAVESRIAVRSVPASAWGSASPGSRIAIRPRVRMRTASTTAESMNTAHAVHPASVSRPSSTRKSAGAHTFSRSHV